MGEVENKTNDMVIWHGNEFCAKHSAKHKF